MYAGARRLLSAAAKPSLVFACTTSIVGSQSMQTEGSGLTPATASFLRDMQEGWQKSPPKSIWDITIDEYRGIATSVFDPLAGERADVDYKDVSLDCGSGLSIPARIYNPAPKKEPASAMIYYPGGAFVAKLGAPHVSISKIAKKTGWVIIVPDCRLAPEYKFPVGVQDAFEVLRWVKSDGVKKYNIDSTKIIVAGDSSGGNFAALVAIWARDHNIKLAHQILISPIVDLSRSLTSHRSYETVDILISKDFIAWAYGHYLPEHFDRKAPMASPYYAELAGVAPTTILMPEFDGIRSDGEAYSVKLKREGVPTDVIPFKGQIHSFLNARKVLSDGDDPVDVISNVMKNLERKHHKTDSPTISR